MLHNYHIFVWTNDKSRSPEVKLGQICVHCNKREQYIDIDGKYTNTANWYFQSEWKNAYDLGKVDQEIIHIIECGHLVRMDS